jgi:hypothetical protein
VISPLELTTRCHGTSLGLAATALLTQSAPNSEGGFRVHTCGRAEHFGDLPIRGDFSARDQTDNIPDFGVERLRVWEGWDFGHDDFLF